MEHLKPLEKLIKINGLQKILLLSIRIDSLSFLTINLYFKFEYEKKEKKGSYLGKKAPIKAC
jgi:hypothetical protein